MTLIPPCWISLPRFEDYWPAVGERVTVGLPWGSPPNAIVTEINLDTGEFYVETLPTESPARRGAEGEPLRPASDPDQGGRVHG